MDQLERRIVELRAALRRAVIARNGHRTRALRAELRAAERAWEAALTALADDPQGVAEPRDVPDPQIIPDPSGRPEPRDIPDPLGAGGQGRSGQDRTAKPGPSLLSVRDQVHHALTLLSVPAAPKLIVEVHHAFFGAPGVAPGRLTYLRRDEERSFRAVPHSRPYYLCSALTAGHLSPARGLLAVSTWPLERRIVGPLSPRVDFLTAAVQVAERAARLPEVSSRIIRLLWRFAANIPGTADRYDADPDLVVKAARAELDVHADTDRSQREAAAERARRQLDEAGQLFGSRLRVLRGTG